MPDPIFDVPRLAAIYDAFDGTRDDLPAYLSLIEELGARHVLDVGCGTGSLAVLLADAGLRVTAADPALASLAVARAKVARAKVARGKGVREQGVREQGVHAKGVREQGAREKDVREQGVHAKGDAIEWLHCAAADLPAVGADLAVMTGNVAQVFLTDDDWTAALRGVRGALRPGGHFVFESRRPEDRGWRRWSTAVVVRDGVEQSFELTAVDPPLVSFRYTYRFPDGEVLTSDSTLRFRDLDELVASLTGFKTIDVRQAPDRPGREFVVICVRADEEG